MILHINAPRFYYIGQIRKAGYIKWETVTGRCSTQESAMSKAVLKMARHKKARVLAIYPDGWYEPEVVMECSR